jgi:hypothetical protein
MGLPTRSTRIVTGLLVFLTLLILCNRQSLQIVQAAAPALRALSASPRCALSQ